jgi:hemerythrin-like domain-containing protein
MADSPTRQLADEHEYVKLVVGAMEAEAAFIERSGRVRSGRLTQMIDFTRNFTDGDHHTKEEDLLFPLLEERSASAGGTISVLLSEHEAARECIRAVDRALPVAEGADPAHAAEARGIIVENLRLYAYLLPLHIGKEDTVLFPLTEEVLSVREQEMLGEDFGRLAAAPRRAATTQKYHRLAHELSTPPVDG